MYVCVCVWERRTTLSNGQGAIISLKENHKQLNPTTITHNYPRRVCPLEMYMDYGWS